MIEPCPLERIKAMLAADVVPLKDGAGIIIPAAVDAHHRASAYRRAIVELEASVVDRDAVRGTGG